MTGGALRRARHRISAVRHCCRSARAANKRDITLQEQRPLHTHDDPQWAERLVAETAEGMAGATFTATVGPWCDVCAVQGSLPRPARGEDTVTTLTGTTQTGTLTGARAYSANDIATALGMPPPTAEQRAVIEAPLAPLLVVAGAGSGKTETMAARVVWLVANGLVEPDQVLGLTFTRKAATELAERIAQRLRRLRAARGSGSRGPTTRTRAPRRWAAHPPCPPTTRMPGGWCASTRCGWATSPSRGCCPRPAAWQYAAEVVQSYDGPMDEVVKAECDHHRGRRRPRRGDGRAPPRRPAR